MTSTILVKALTRFRRWRGERERAAFVHDASRGSVAVVRGAGREGSTLEGQIHPNAGVGHQMSSWIAAESWASDLGLTFAGANLVPGNGLFDLEATAPAPGRPIRLASVPDGEISAL